MTSLLHGHAPDMRRQAPHGSLHGYSTKVYILLVDIYRTERNLGERFPEISKVAVPQVHLRGEWSEKVTSSQWESDVKENEVRVKEINKM